MTRVAEKDMLRRVRANQTATEAGENVPLGKQETVIQMNHEHLRLPMQRLSDCSNRPKCKRTIVSYT